MRLAALLITSVVLLAVAAGSASAQAPLDGPCTQTVPAASPSTATTPRIELRVLVLLDGVPIARGAHAMEVARDVYAPLGIDLVARYQTVDFAATDAPALVDEAKELFGGERPSWTHLVYVLTDEDLYPNDNVLRNDACVAGIRDPGTAFVAGGTVDVPPNQVGRFALFAAQDGEWTAHMLGHLLGGQHHHGMCGAGATPEDPDRVPVGACTLMSGEQSLWVPRFGPVDGAVLRGYAEAFAPPIAEPMPDLEPEPDPETEPEPPSELEYVDREFDEQNDCNEFVPNALPSVATAPELELRVHVLLDRIAQADGDAMVEDLAATYAPLGIRVVPSFQPVAFSGTDARSLIAQAKALLGGERPPSAHLVYTFTSVDIEGEPSGSAVVGLADCIGGIRHAERAFAVGENSQLGPVTFNGLTLIHDGPGLAAAHELGHLLGARHEYGDCVKGTAPGHPEAVHPCTVMFPDAALTSRQWGFADGSIVRGFAEAYATPIVEPIP